MRPEAAGGPGGRGQNPPAEFSELGCAATRVSRPVPSSHCPRLLLKRQALGHSPPPNPNSWGPGPAQEA